MIAIKNIVILLFIVYAILLITLYFFQRSLIYFPTQPAPINSLIDTSVIHNGIRLQGYMANEKRPSLILYFGGNAEQIEYGLQELALAFPASTIAGFHYRGYSGSEGKPSEAALFTDALYIHDLLSVDYPSISVIGRSLGSGVATYLASQRPVKKLVLVTPFDSIQSLAASRFPFMPVKWLLIDKFMSASYAKNIKTPTLLLTAEKDTIVPQHHSIRLHQAFPQTAIYKTLSQVDHNTISLHPEYILTIKAFIGEDREAAISE